MSSELRAVSPRFFDDIQLNTAPVVFEEAFGQYLPVGHSLRVMGQAITSYFLMHGALAEDRLQNSDLSTIAEAIDGIAEVVGDTPIYKDGQFKYFYRPNGDINELSQQVMGNAQYMAETFGIGLFEKHPEWSRTRYTHLKALLPGGFYMSLKGGSGSGTFAVDLALGLDRGQKTRIGGEFWKTGLDTAVDPATGKRAARIIRTGSGTAKHDSDWEEKTQAFEKFKRIFGMSPARATIFLTMFMAHDLPDVGSLQAITLEGVQNRTLTHAKNSSKIRFNYTERLKECGFKESKDPDWLEISNDPESFYRAIQTDPARNGLRRGETSGLDRLVDAFRNLRCVRGSALSAPLICVDSGPEELGAALPVFQNLRP